MKTSCKEIGSEFWAYPPLSEKENGLFPSDTLWLGAGRQAFPLIAEDIRRRQPFGTVALPSWCCHSMIEPFLELGIEPLFYDVLPAPEGGLRYVFPPAGTADAILVMDYFGYASSDLPLPEGVVIRDLTHGVFTRIPDDADYYFGSLRKWGAFATGGFVWKRGGRLPSGTLTPDDAYIKLRRAAFAQKADYIKGGAADKRFLEVFHTAEESLRSVPVRGGDPQDEAAARAVDTVRMRAVRRRNAEILLETAGDLAVFPRLGPDDCPLFVPILVPDGKRDALRGKFTENGVFLPVHWPLTELHHISRDARVFYENGLSLVCDQRYGADDMQRICELLRQFL
ncbi:MAG: hypothetical protein IJK89_06625 [Clostridia bacterium]|nr:hypothetical protein [Clostridia bacterium]